MEKRRDPLEFYFPSGVKFAEEFADYFGTRRRCKCLK